MYAPSWSPTRPDGPRVGGPSEARPEQAAYAGSCEGWRWRAASDEHDLKDRMASEGAKMAIWLDRGAIGAGC